MRVRFAGLDLPEGGSVALLLTRPMATGGVLGELDARLKGAVGRAAAAQAFVGKAGEVLTLHAPEGYERVVLVGLGEAEGVSLRAFEEAGGRLAPALAGAPAASVVVETPGGVSFDPGEAAARVAFGLRLGAWRPAGYRGRPSDDPLPPEDMTIRTIRPAAAEIAYNRLGPVADGVLLARDLVTAPGNRLGPEDLAAQAEALAGLGVEVEVMGESRIRKNGLELLLGVGRGSARKTRLVALRWNNGKKAGRPVALIGKGLTFDTGGISLKRSHLPEMKEDMAGAAAVIGAFRALAGRGAAVDAVGVLGIAENMPGGDALRPGDILRSGAGRTVEVVDTDAEGRLVLADCLWYARDRFNPVAMIDLATLTGSIVTALGHHRAGLFATSDTLAAAVRAAGEAVSEPVWRMPLAAEYEKRVESEVADLKNAEWGRSADALFAAQFLKRFVGRTPWAHLDMAGVASVEEDGPLGPKGATGWGVRLLDRLIADRYEAK